MLAKMQMCLMRGLELTRPRLRSSVHERLGRGLSNSRNGALPTRSEQLNTLKSEDFDVLVIGGGVIGCGCALESASRGLKTALVEAADFANGASSKSSKVIEGSDSYLHAAIQEADWQQIHMLQMVLSERAIMLTIAPHLNRVQPMLMPIYSPLKLPLYWLGLKCYDAMAGMANVRASHYLSKEGTLNEFPLLRQEGLLGALVYYDGQLDDSRMCLALAITAIKHGAIAINYVKAIGFKSPDEEGDCRLAMLRDKLTNMEFIVKSKCVINATGTATNEVRKMNDNSVNPIAVPRLGTHISLPSYYGSSKCGLVFPSNGNDDPPLLMLPFENRLLVGSMAVNNLESGCNPFTPQPKEVNCLLGQTRLVLEKCVKLRADHVLSAWRGTQLSVMKPCSKENGQAEEVMPNYLVEISDNGMITLAGGRWSTYRIMASDAIDTAIETCELTPRSAVSCTHTLLLDGAEYYDYLLPLNLVQTCDLPMDVAQHLAESYGSNAYQLMSRITPYGRRRLHPKFPYIAAEVSYACTREYACTLVDVIARRLRVAFVDVGAAFEMLPLILDIMSKHHRWKPDKQKKQLKSAKNFLIQQMGLGSTVNPKNKICFQDLRNNTPKLERTESVIYPQAASPDVIDSHFQQTNTFSIPGSIAKVICFKKSGTASSPKNNNFEIKRQTDTQINTEKSE